MGFKQNLHADVSGSNLHIAVRCGADARQALVRLSRYIGWPALANERVQCNPASQVVLKLKIPWREGMAHVVMTSLKFVQRLAAVVTPLRRLANEPLTIRVRERLLRGGQFRTAGVSEGSGAARCVTVLNALFS